MTLQYGRCRRRARVMAHCALQRHAAIRQLPVGIKFRDSIGCRKDEKMGMKQPEKTERERYIHGISQPRRNISQQGDVRIVSRRPFSLYSGLVTLQCKHVKKKIVKKFTSERRSYFFSNPVKYQEKNRRNVIKDVFLVSRKPQYGHVPAIQIILCQSNIQGIFSCSGYVVIYTSHRSRRNLASCNCSYGRWPRISCPVRFTVILSPAHGFLLLTALHQQLVWRICVSFVRIR